jgi:dienelactone hydrolase
MLLCGALVSHMAVAQNDPAWFGPRLIEEQVRIPVQEGGYEIAATILRPDGPGPYGVVVLNHGVPVTAEERAHTSAAHFNASAPIFARRGYAVIMPMRRGFGATGGPFAEDAGPCSNPDFVHGENAAADDVMAAYDYARTLPYVDPSRMVLAGQSAGGMVSIFAAATRHPAGLVAVLSFAGGRGGNPSLNPGVPCAIEPLAEVFDAIGRSIDVPVLFHYAENDHFFGPKVSHEWYERFTAAGAKAEYVLQPPFGSDGHFVFADLIGVRYWLPTVEHFFAEHGIPFERLDMPENRSEPLFVARPPFIHSKSCDGLYRVFLESPGPRAYAVSEDGHCGFAGGMADARDEALKQCDNVALSSSCALYAEDRQVVWRQPETTFASVGATAR